MEWLPKIMGAIFYPLFCPIELDNKFITIIFKIIQNSTISCSKTHFIIYLIKVEAAKGNRYNHLL